MEDLIQRHWAAMGEVDTKHRVKLIVDEWGAWHRAGSEVHPAYLFGQTPTLRDALISAITLDTFNRHADKVVMANVAQLINNLHALFLANEDRFVVTPNFHVFEMYTAHHGGNAVRTEFSAPRATERLWGLAGSASMRNQKLTLTVVNPHSTQARETEIAVRGATPTRCQTRTLTSGDIHAHNTFDAPRGIEPEDGSADIGGAVMTYRFPPASVTRLEVTLA